MYACVCRGILTVVCISRPSIRLRSCVERIRRNGILHSLSFWLNVVNVFDAQRQWMLRYLMNFRTSAHAIFNLVESELMCRRTLLFVHSTGTAAAANVRFPCGTAQSNRDFDLWLRVNVFVRCRHHKNWAGNFASFSFHSHNVIAQSILSLENYLKLCEAVRCNSIFDYFFKFKWPNWNLCGTQWRESLPISCKKLQKFTHSSHLSGTRLLTFN